MSKKPLSQQAQTFHEAALVWDSTFPFFNNYLFSTVLSGATVEQADSCYQSLERFRNAGVNCVSLTIAGARSNISFTLSKIAQCLAFIRANEDKYKLVKRVEDIQVARDLEKLAVSFNFQGIDSLESNLDMVEIYYQLGIRHMLLAYNTQNIAGTGCQVKDDTGLSHFGRSLVGEMNRVGMIVDASHTGYRTTMDIFEHSSAPVIFSHSNPYTLRPHGRNIKDDQIQACAQSGGVIGVVGFDDLLPGGKPTVEAMIQAVDYLVEKAGPDHVGIGLDWVYCPELFRDIQKAGRDIYPSSGNNPDGEYQTEAEGVPPEALSLFTQGLMDKGYCEADIRKILGENWLRVAREVWK